MTSKKAQQQDLRRSWIILGTMYFLIMHPSHQTSVDTSNVVHIFFLDR